MWRPVPRQCGLAAMSVLIPAMWVGCTVAHAELEPGGAKVLVIERPLEVKGCDSLGNVSGNASSLLGDVEAERTINARNRAATLGGNRVVPRQVTLLGAREFEVFYCPESNPPPPSTPLPATAPALR